MRLYGCTLDDCRVVMFLADVGGDSHCPGCGVESELLLRPDTNGRRGMPELAAPAPADNPEGL